MEVIFWNRRIEKFIKDLDDETAMRVDHTVGLLEKLGHLIAMPDSKSLGRGLFELRILGNNQVRILHVFKNNRAHIIHGFVKKTSKISHSDIEYARRIQKEVSKLA